MRAFSYPSLDAAERALSTSGNKLTQRNTHRRSCAWRCAGAAMRRQNKSFADKNGATPHPPAVSGSGNFFSFIFLQTRTPDRTITGGFADNQN